MFKDRIQYVQNILIPANMEYTPLWLYLRHLEENGRDINSDIEQYVTDNPSAPYLGIDSEFVAGYVQHIYSVIASMQDREDIQAEIRRAERSGSMTLEEFNQRHLQWWAENI